LPAVFKFRGAAKSRRDAGATKTDIVQIQVSDSIVLASQFWLPLRIHLDAIKLPQGMILLN